MSEEEQVVKEKAGCGFFIGSLLLVIAILAVIFFMLINPWLMSKDIDVLGRLNLRFAGSEKTELTSGGNPDAAGTAIEENIEKSGDVESAGEDIQEQTAKPVKVIDPDGNVQEDNEDSWY